MYYLPKVEETTSPSYSGIDCTASIFEFGKIWLHSLHLQRIYICAVWYRSIGCGLEIDHLPWLTTLAGYYSALLCT